MVIKKMDVVFYRVERSKWNQAKEFYSNTLGFKQVFGADEMGWIEYRVEEDHTTAIAISLVEDGEVHPEGGGTAVFIVDNLESAISELKSKGVEFSGEIYVDEMIKFIKFQDPCKNQLQLVEVLITED